MNRMLGAMLIVGLTVLMTGCEDGGGGNVVTLTLGNDGSVVSVAQGDEVEVVLPGNQSSGYQWEVVETDWSLLSSLGSSYTAASDEIGAGGHFQFRFKADAPGEVRLQMAYRHPWETTVAQTFTVTIKIS